MFRLSSHPIEALMKTTMESIKDMVDVNTIVGDPVETPEGTTIIPISRVSFGFASGGGEYKEKTKQSDMNDYDNQQKFPFAGGTGAGVSVQPVAFMVVGKDSMKLLSVDQNANMFDNLINLTSRVVDKMQSNNGKKDKKKKENSEEE